MRTQIVLGAACALLSTTCGDDAANAGPIEAATIVHQFPDVTLAAFEEVQPCISWRINNDEPIYVNGVSLSNGGGFHHSNWFIVPEDAYDGPDGVWKCSDRDFSELGSIVDHSAGVLFAQSTQSRVEEQTLPEGVVIKIPPRHKVIAGAHLLNLSAAEITTNMRMALDLVHPKKVEKVLAPARFSYYSIDIPAQSEARFTGECSFAYEYENVGGRPMDMQIYWLLPHYHYLGNYFRVDIQGGPRDGEEVFKLDGFNADANGKVFDPPIDMTGADGLKFTCGYDNFLNKSIQWGIGDQEMCVMLVLSDTALMMDMFVDIGSQIVDLEDGVPVSQGPCFITPLPKNSSQTLPTDEEREAEMYVPPSDEGDEGLPPVAECEDVDVGATPSGPATLGEIRDTILTPGCVFSSCHGGTSPAAGLDLRVQNLHGALVDVDAATNGNMKLVAPGDPEGSWLYQLISNCEPENAAGAVVPHMPRNAAQLLDDRLVATVRAWIEAGAPPE